MFAAVLRDIKSEEISIKTANSSKDIRFQLRTEDIQMSLGHVIKDGDVNQ